MYVPKIEGVRAAYTCTTKLKNLIRITKKFKKKIKKKSESTHLFINSPLNFTFGDIVVCGTVEDLGPYA